MARSTTQHFTEIQDIADSIVFFKGGNACAILEVSSINFFLLSQEEQNARMYGYMSMLNSLSFYIQIFIVSKRIDLSFYVKMLDQRIDNEKSPKIAEQLKIYREFIRNLIKGEELLDKKVYIVIPFSDLELGGIGGTTLKTAVSQTSTQKIKESITSKKNQVLVQVHRLGLSARQLETEEMVKLFYELFNDSSIRFDFHENDVGNIIL